MYVLSNVASTKPIKINEVSLIDLAQVSLALEATTRKNITFYVSAHHEYFQLFASLPVIVTVKSICDGESLQIVHSPSLLIQI